MNNVVTAERTRHLSGAVAVVQGLGSDTAARTAGTWHGMRVISAVALSFIERDANMHGF